MDTKFEKHILDNGVTVLSERLPAMHTAAVGCWLRAGSRNEPDGSQGGFHFIEHMLFKGTRRRDARQIAIDVENVGAHLNAMTGKENTCFYGKSLSEDLPMLVDVLTDMVFDSIFDPAEFTREMQVILEEITSRDDTPEDFISEQYLEDRLGRLGLGHSVLGYNETVGAFTRDSLRALWRNAYRPSQLIVAVAGNLNGADPVVLVTRALGRIEEATLAGAPDPVPEPAATFRNDIRVYSRDVEQTQFILGVPGAPYNHPDHYTYILLDMILSGGMSSRLFQEVREKLGLVYDIQSSNECYRDAGFFCISAGTRPANLRQVIEVTARELAGIRRGEVRETELERVKRQLRASMAMSFENVAGRMMKIARSEIYHGRDIPDSEIMDKLQAVTRDDIQRAARALFNPGAFAASILGPYGDDTAPIAALIPEVLHSVLDE